MGKEKICEVAGVVACLPEAQGIYKRAGVSQGDEVVVDTVLAQLGWGL